MKTSCLHTVHALAALLWASGCETRAEVLSTADATVIEDGGASDDSGASGQQPFGSGPGNPAVHIHIDASIDAGFLPGVQDVISQPDGDVCASAPVEVLDGLDIIESLAVNATQVYVSTDNGIVRSDRDGADRKRISDLRSPEIVADERALYWIDDMNLQATSIAGESTTAFAPVNQLEGLSQDADWIYAVAGSELVHIAKSGTGATALVGPKNGVTVDRSRTANDDSFVYFVTGSPSLGRFDLERVRKDGSERERLATNITDITDFVMAAQLLVDENYVYIAGDGEISRVPVTGGEVERIVEGLAGLALPPPTAQDGHCLYYGDDGYFGHEGHDEAATLKCISKSDGSLHTLFSLRSGRIVELAMAGDELYFGVTVERTFSIPTIDGPDWVGRLTCPATTP
jgi:hypothetical protein